MKYFTQYREKQQLIECVYRYGFTDGSKVYWLCKYINLDSNKQFSREELIDRLLDYYSIPGLDRTSLEETFELLDKMKLDLPF